MIDIAELIIEPPYEKLTKEELTKISNNSVYAIDNIVDGLQAIGKLMFFASTNDNYDGEAFKKDIQKIGLLIEAKSIFLKRIIDINSGSDYHLTSKEYKSESSK